MLSNIQDLLLLQQAKESEKEVYYEVLEKITLSGVEYFDLGYKVSDFEIGDTIRFEGIVKGTDAGSITSSGSQLMYSIGNDGGQWLGKAQNGTKYAFGSSNQSTISFNEEVLADVTIALSGNANKPTFTITGSVTSDTATSTITQRSATPTYYDFPLLFGAGTKSTGEKAYGGDYTIKCGKIYVNGIMTKDFVPVLDSQMRPCLYDRIGKTFTYAKKIADGSTTYDLGFKRWNKYDVDYIENTGTSYIALSDITPSTTMGMNIEYAYTTLSSSEPAGVIGTYNGDTQRKDTFFVSTSSGSTQKAISPSSASCGVMVFHRGGNIGTSSSSSASYIEPEKDVWYQATVNWLGDGEIYWTNGSTDLQASVGENAVLTNGLRLFSRCNSSNNTYNNCKSRVRKLQFSDGSTIIRDYVPVVWHNGDNTAVATLYDKVYNRMLTPTGSLKAYLAPEKTVYKLSMHDTIDTDGFYIGEEGVKTVSSDGTSCYTNAIPVKQGDIITWTVTAEAVSANKRIHGYSTNADIPTGEKGSWVEMLAKIVFSTTSETTQTATFVVPSGVNYIRLSHANVRESQCYITLTRTYEVGKSVSGNPSSSVLGVSNCFDTGLYGTQDTTVKYLAIAYDATTSSGQLFGSYDGTQATSQNLTINSTGTGSTAPIRFDGQVITTPIKIPANQFASIVTNKYGLFVDNSLHGSWGSVNDFTTTTTMLILKCNNSTNTRNNGCCYCLIEESNVLIAEFIPVRNKTVTSEYGLYDRVSRTLNTGSGTITFNTL